MVLIIPFFPKLILCFIYYLFKVLKWSWLFSEYLSVIAWKLATLPSLITVHIAVNLDGIHYSNLWSRVPGIKCIHRRSLTSVCFSFMEVNCNFLGLKRSNSAFGWTELVLLVSWTRLKWLETWPCLGWPDAWFKLVSNDLRLVSSMF